MKVMRFVIGLLIALALAAPSARAQGVTVKFMTTPAGGPYAPRNVVVVWIEDSAGNFVKTIGRWAGQRKNYLVAWVAKAGPNDVDAVTSATRGDHSVAIQAIWNLQDRNGTVVPDGTYTIKLEMADSDAGTQTANHEGTFTFVKSPQPQVQTNQASGGFDNATISYAAQAACGNSVIDPGETCDPSSSCPTTCADSGDKCMPNVLVGLADSCTAQCQQQAVTGCKDNDGCCPLGCTTANDNDCGNGGPPEANSDDNSHAVVGGCSASPATSLFGLVAGGFLMLLPRRRRR
jgi:uncharacterized protein (TIGR03382 family)